MSIIIASKGIAAGILDPSLFSGIIVVVFASVLLAPALLKLVYTDKFVNFIRKK